MMNNFTLENIFQLNKSEKKYLEDDSFISPIYDNLPKVIVDNQSIYKFLLPELNQNIVEIRRDSRFTDVPKHIHSNLNINYIFSGECRYIINSEEYTLTQGDICIIDRNVIRSKKKLSHDDIVFNISLSNDFFSREFLTSLGEASLLTHFLFSAITQNSKHDGFLIFNNKDAVIQNYFNLLIEEYLKNDSFSRYSIDSLFSLIFIQLIRNYQKNSHQQVVHMNTEISAKLLDVLIYIEKNANTCTLKQTAEHFSYHPKYLSQKIKHTFKKSFKDIQTEQRLKNAIHLLESTNQPISEISYNIGMTNVTQFYKKFQQKYEMTPLEYRKNLNK